METRMLELSRSLEIEFYLLQYNLNYRKPRLCASTNTVFNVLLRRPLANDSRETGTWILWYLNSSIYLWKLQSRVQELFGNIIIQPPCQCNVSGTPFKTHRAEILLSKILSRSPSSSSKLKNYSISRVRDSPRRYLSKFCLRFVHGVNNLAAISPTTEI